VQIVNKSIPTPPFLKRGRKIPLVTKEGLGEVKGRIMKWEFHLLFMFIGIGLLTKRVTWKGWFAISVLVFSWIMFNWKRM